MSITYISAALRRLVIERAGGCCEYCYMAQEVGWLPYEIDHIRLEKHGGETTEDNLCFSLFAAIPLRVVILPVKTR